MLIFESTVNVHCSFDKGDTFYYEMINWNICYPRGQLLFNILKSSLLAKMIWVFCQIFLYKVCWKCLHQCFSYLSLNYFGICKISHESTERKCTFDSADKETYRMLAARRDQYKHAALKAKHTGDITTATQHVKVAKVTIGTSRYRICSYKCSSCRGFLCV